VSLSQRSAIDIIRLIGTLDRCISELLIVANNADDYHEADIQTVKHHAEDMILAGKSALKRLGYPTSP
jgi:hypothetical protein